MLIISVIASTITSAHQARPLNEMAEAARKFGRGEFDVRVTGYEGRCDEISTLAESFNTMANSLAKVESQRSEFIANVSHELKTPMTTISGFARAFWTGPSPRSGSGSLSKSSCQRPGGCPVWCGGCWTCPG